MKRFWCCRDLEGAANEEVFLFVGEEPPIMDDDGEWVDPRKEGLFWSEEDFNFDFDKLLGTVKFPELNMMMNGILLMKRQRTILG